jgi:hypothetical protein
MAGQSWPDDRPYSMSEREYVDPEVKRNLRPKPKCEHENNAGECLICWRYEHGEKE